MEERLQKLMAQAGIASRREAELMIEQGRVTLNGRRAQIGDKADPEKDDIRVDGARLRIDKARVYILLNKPMGVVTTVRAQKQERRRTVRDLVPLEGHLYPVGRLDADSEGLILLTNDGELAQRLSHPRYRHAKVYEVTLFGRIPDETLDIWRRGVVLDDGPTQPVEIKVLQRDAKFSVLQVTMLEGRKRQVRRIGATLGYPVRHLVRTHLATLALGDLKPGEWRHLTEAEVRALQASAFSTNNPSMSERGRAERRPDETARRAAPKERPAREGKRPHDSGGSAGSVRGGGSRRRRPSSGRPGGASRLRRPGPKPRRSKTAWTPHPKSKQPSGKRRRHDHR